MKDFKHLSRWSDRIISYLQNQGLSKLEAGMFTHTLVDKTLSAEERANIILHQESEYKIETKIDNPEAIPYLVDQTLSYAMSLADKSKNKPYSIGIVGRPGSGKSKFTLRLKKNLKHEGISAHVITGDTYIDEKRNSFGHNLMRLYDNLNKFQENPDRDVLIVDYQYLDDKLFDLFIFMDLTEDIRIERLEERLLKRKREYQKDDDFFLIKKARPLDVQFKYLIDLQKLDADVITTNNLLFY